MTSWTAALQASLSFTISQSLLKFMSIDPVIPSNHLILCHPLLLLPPIFPSIRVFSSESALCIGWPKNWSFSFSSVLSMNIQGWFPLGLTCLISLMSKGLSSVFSNSNSKASILWRSVFFMVQVSHLYVTTEKNYSLIIWTFVNKVMSLPLNMLSRFVITFLLTPTGT